MDEKEQARVTSKLFFERYYDGKGKEHVQASLVTNSTSLEQTVREWLAPTKASKIGSMYHFFWLDDDAESVVNELGPKALQKWENVWSQPSG